MDKKEIIIKRIRDAQIASDAGKGIYELGCDDHDYSIENERYNAKDRNILLAIKGICRLHDKSIRFYVKDISYYSWDPKVIVYFDFKINGKREQVSFHSFSWRIREFAKNSRASTWDRKSSRKAAERAYREGITQR